MKKYDLRKNDIAEIIAICADALKIPGCVLLTPTETVYGLICRYDDEKAVQRIYDLKGREKNKPLALFADSVGTLEKFGVPLTRNAEKLAAKFCPGALTIVVPIPDDDTVGFRIPDHPFMLGLLKRLKYPLASTSANRSGEPNALNMNAALEMLAGEVDIAVDGGAIPPARLASTVVMALENELKILRPGPVSEAQLHSAI
ncbi:MAG: L-threonylcarbamoyladenylate synthase [Victivallaceae bacterium]|nr:L-threonylcarbamoyladenylate synthase [Victivallaceae bacterium]